MFNDLHKLSHYPTEVGFRQIEMDNCIVSAIWSNLQLSRSRRASATATTAQQQQQQQQQPHNLGKIVRARPCTYERK